MFHEDKHFDLFTNVSPAPRNGAKQVPALVGEMNSDVWTEDLWQSGKQIQVTMEAYLQAVSLTACPIVS